MGGGVREDRSNGEMKSSIVCGEWAGEGRAPQTDRVGVRSCFLAAAHNVTQREDPGLEHAGEAGRGPTLPLGAVRREQLC